MADGEMGDDLQGLVIRLRDEEARVEACASLLELLKNDDGGTVRDRAAELNAVPGLVEILHDFLDAHDDHVAALSKKDETSAAGAAAAAARMVWDALELTTANALRALIHLTSTSATRLRVVDAGGIPPVSRLMDADVFPESVSERAVVLLIRCCTQTDAEENRVGVADDFTPDPLCPAAKARKSIAQNGGLPQIIKSMRRASTGNDPAGCRAVHLLSLIADDPAVRDAFLCSEEGKEEEERRREAFAALAPFLRWETSSSGASGTISVSQKHAAVAVNSLCVDSVPNKEAFARAGGIPPLAALLFGPEGNAPGRRKEGAVLPLNIIPVVTKTVVDAISTLAVDNDTCDQVIYETGVLPALVSLLVDPRCDVDLRFAAALAVMHMARDSRDAKRQLTDEGVVPKMRDIIESYEPASETSERLVVPAISCLVNVAVDTEHWGQTALAEENVAGPVTRVFEFAAPKSKVAQVCVAFVHAFVKNNPENGRIVAESGVLPVLAYHHLHSRNAGRVGDALEKRAAREALVTLGAAADAADSAREWVSSACGDLLLRECLIAGAGPGARVPPAITDEKRMEKELRALAEITEVARESRDGASFARAAEAARTARRKKRAQEIFDAELALEKKLVQRLAAREKALAEAEAARIELRKAQARVGLARNDVKKEVNEARAAKKDLEAAKRALARKIAKEGENSKAAEGLREIVLQKQKIYEKEQREADDAVAAHEREEANARAALRSLDAKPTEVAAAEAEASDALKEAAARKEKLDAMDVRARRRFIEQEEAAAEAARKAAKKAARVAERIANGASGEHVDVEAAEEEEDDDADAEDDDDPFDKKCCVVS